MALSDLWLKANNNKQFDKVFEKADRDGMSVRVSAKGKIVFQLRYRYLGRAKRCDLGSYPLMSLKDARAEALRLRAELEKGNDPRVVKVTEVHKKAGIPSMQALFNEWYQSFCIKEKQNHKDIKRSFEIHVFPKIGKLPADSVTLHIWLEILEPLMEKVPSIADRVLTNSKQMYKWAIKRLILKHNPLYDLFAKSDLGFKKKRGDRVLDDDEIILLFKCFDGSRMAQKNKVFLKLCLYYGCRNGELRKSHIEHFDFGSGVWTVPPENHKRGAYTGRPLLRPITEASAELIREAISLSNSDVFLVTNANDDEMMSNSSTLSLPTHMMQWIRKNEAVEMKHWSCHDLRRTVRTRLSAITTREIAELMVGHALPSMQETYDYHDYHDEMKRAYETWWAHVTELVQR